MLHEFLTENRDELIARCRAKVARRPAARPTELELQHGIPHFLEQLTRTLLRRQTSGASNGDGGFDPAQPEENAARSEIGETAASHGDELLRGGFTVDQVVHDYGDLCQAVTELAVERKASITTEEFRTLNMCLDNAIAGAVTEYGRGSERRTVDEGMAAANERLGFLAHELRNLLNSAMLSVEAIKAGNVGISGATGAVLDRSLRGLRDLIDRSLAEVRLTAGIPERRERIRVCEFIDEVQVSAVLEARARRVALAVAAVAPHLFVDADRQILSSALANLLQNAFKFTRDGGRVSLSVRATAERVFIDVEDACGGLPPGKAEELFRPFAQRAADRSGLGLGLSISRRGVEANGGRLEVRNLPDKGCVFTIDLPLQQPPAAE